jgi:DNA (cytosine-5)-methyltransferase 1
MKVGTDFSGIGAPEMALKYLGIDFESVFACEIDKYARQSFKQLHKPNTFYNDITTRNHKEVEQLDLYVAGFPCQAFSTAGKRKGFEEARGTLFFNVAEFIQINQPKVFVLENVKGLLSHDKGNTFQTIVDILSNGGGTQNGQISLDVFEDGLGYHIYWQVLNTKEYGIPQNRERIFIVGFKDFREFSFPKPMQLKLRLRDILQDNPKLAISGKYQPYPRNYKELGLERIERFEKRDDNLSNCLLANEMSYIEVENKYHLSDKLIQSFTKHKERHTEKGTGFKWEVKKNDDIANCLRANASLCPTDNTIKISKKIRRLTPLECWRLQGFRDEDFFSVKDVSDTQLYKQAGNSITVDVLMELFKKIYANDNK